MPNLNDARGVDLYLDQLVDGDYYLNIENLADFSGVNVFVKDLKARVGHAFSLNPICHFQTNF